MQGSENKTSACNDQQGQKDETNDGKTPQSAHIIFDDSSESETETSTDDSSSKANLCEVCLNNVPKYTCPGCGLRTCCLACVKDHKIKLNCSGQRNKFTTVDKSDYSDMHLLNDYRFLEYAERSVYSNKVTPRDIGKPDRFHPYSFGYHYNKKSRILISGASRRGVHLKIMPDLERHKSNSSFYRISSDTMEWHVEWLFVSSNSLVKDKKVLESCVLLEAVEKFGNAVDYPHLRKAMDEYRKQFDLCHYFIKVEGMPANRKRFVKLNPSQTLGENLKGLCLVEYPTIYVLPQGYKTDDFVELEEDDLSHMDHSNMRHVTRRHPTFSNTDCLQEQLLDPMSGVYKPDKIKHLDEASASSDTLDHLTDKGHARSSIKPEVLPTKVARLLENLNQITSQQRKC